MPETLDVDALIAAAAEAAGREDPSTAVRFLRRALNLQIASFGPDHRELAPTLNNLALMLERQGNNDEAEQCYRRAYDIARRGAGPNDPLVVVSRANLQAFLQAFGVSDPSLDEFAAAPMNAHAPEQAAEPRRPTGPTPQAVKPSPPATPAAAPRVSVPPPAPPAPRASPPPAQRTAAPSRAAAPASRTTASAPPRAAAPAPPPSAPSAVPGRGWTIASLAVVGAAAGAFASWLYLAPPQANRTAPPLAQAAPAGPQPAPSAPARTEPPAPPVQSPQKTPPAAEPSPAQSAPAAPGTTASAAVPPAKAAPASNAEGLSADTRLCAALIRTSREWRCDAVATPVDSDAVYYYTRVRTPRDAVMRHQWSYQGQVVRTVNLEVRANAEVGFRTFSRQTVSGRGSGDWEVALIAPNGAVIDTQRFAVAER